ncbi:hypothetical protein AKO1_006008 [Acrasis kona]|uniref:Fanconi anemia group I protein n=1 Tax=Acrasis kona TaxID=1008807 RepID=A0AAW2ZM95_9EUKA
MGLSNNASVTLSCCFEYLVDLSNDKNLYHKTFAALSVNLDRFSTDYKHKKVDKQKQKDDNYLVQKDPGRSGHVESNDHLRTSSQLLESRDHIDHVIVQFAMELMEIKIKQSSSNALFDASEMRILINTFVARLIKYVSGKYVGLALASLRILIILSQRFNKKAGELDQLLKKSRQVILNAVFDLIAHVGIDASSDTWDTLFMGIKYLLQQQDVKMTDSQVIALLDILKVEIYGSSQNKQHNLKAYQLVKILIDQKIVMPQLYDMMDRIKTTMLTANEERIQDECISMLTQFYIHYPFDESVRQDQFQFMFKNIMNQSLSLEGKCCLVKLTRNMIVQLPPVYLGEKCELIFFPLALQLSNTSLDNSTVNQLECTWSEDQLSCQLESKMQDALYQFLKRINDNVLDQHVLNLISKQWIRSDKLKYVAIRTCVVLSRLSNGQRLKSAGHLDVNRSDSIINLIIDHIINNDFECNKKKQKCMLVNSLQFVYELYQHLVISDVIVGRIMQKICTTGVASTIPGDLRFACFKMIDLYTTRNQSHPHMNESLLSDLIDNWGQSSKKKIYVGGGNRQDEYVQMLIKVTLSCMNRLIATKSSSPSEQEHLGQIISQLRNISVKCDLSKCTRELVQDHYLNMLKLFVAMCSKLKSKMNAHLTLVTPLLYICTEYPSRSEQRAVSAREENFALDCKRVIRQQWESMNQLDVFVDAYEQGKLEVHKKSTDKKKKEDLKAVKDPIAYAKQKLSEQKTKKRKRSSGDENVDSVKRRK